MSAMVIAIANNKGGTGKTSTAVNLAAGLAAELAQRTGPAGTMRGVLLVDLDPQGNTADHFGVRDRVYDPSMGDHDTRPGISKLLTDPFGQVARLSAA